MANEINPKATDTLINNVVTFEDNAFKQASKVLERAANEIDRHSRVAYTNDAEAGRFLEYDNGNDIDEFDELDDIGTSKRAGRYHRAFPKEYTRGTHIFFMTCLALMSISMSITSFVILWSTLR